VPETPPHPLYNPHSTNPDQFPQIYKPATQKEFFIWDVLMREKNADRTKILKNQSKKFLRDLG